MPDATTINMTDRELLIRIDERLKSVERQITAIQSTSIPPSEHAQLMLAVKDHDRRLDGFDSFRVKMGVYIAIAGTVGGLIVAALSSFITDLIQHVMGGK